MAKSGLAFSVALGTVLIALLATPALGERYLESGEKCAFPLEFNGKLVYDCIDWNNEEWCRSAAELWGKCKKDDGATTQRVNASPEKKVSNLIADYTSPVIINEVLANPAEGEKDFVEIINVGDKAVDLTGWKMYDHQKAKAEDEEEDKDENNDFIFGASGCKNTSSIAANATMLLKKDEPCSFTFGLGRKDSLTLLDADGKIVDTLKWKKENSLEGVSYGRLPDGSGPFIRSAVTPNKKNAPASVEKLREQLPVGTDVTDSCCKKLESIGFKSNLPVLIFDTKCQELVDEPKIRTQLCTCSDEVDYNGWAGIEIRGSSSARDHEKKGMALQLWNTTGHDVEFPLLGLPKDEDWVLYGPETDRSIGLRNFMAYNISRTMGNYASRTKFAEVFLQDDCKPLSMKDYHGVYLLEEKIKRHKKRVDVCKHDPEDITGGYIFKHDNDNIDKGDIVFPIKKRYNSRDLMPMVMTYPKGEKAQYEREVNYLEQYLNGFEMALQRKDFSDPEMGYAKYIDVDSFVDYFLGTEITKNPDAYRGSTYMHKDCGKPFAMGPMWDYNEAFGMCCGYPIEGYMNSGKSNGISGGSAISTNGWRFNICEDEGRCKRDPVDGISHWFVRLWEDPIFRQKAAKRWKELRDGPLSNNSINAILDEQIDYIRPAATRNYNRWFNVIGSKYYKSTREQWEKEAKALREWLIGHMNWMDSELAKHRGGLQTFGTG